mmetsp:Transcript_22196/g.36725  ORF Transcript_22196/g.36725 Transcript_22196/m.36725 type:complete len:224 (-) Transcript_22196:1358-2029(-)
MNGDSQWNPYPHSFARLLMYSIISWGCDSSLMGNSTSTGCPVGKVVTMSLALPSSSSVMTCTLRWTSSKSGFISSVIVRGGIKIGLPSRNWSLPKSSPLPDTLYDSVPDSPTVGIFSILASPMRFGLPVGPLGMASMTTITRGSHWRLNPVMPSRKSSILGGSHPALGTTAVPTTSPYITAGVAKHTQVSTPGTFSNCSSISRGEIFSPPQLIISLKRPTSWT